MASSNRPAPLEIGANRSSAPPARQGRTRSDSDTTMDSTMSGRGVAKRLPRWRRRVGDFVDSRHVTIVMTIFTIYALFGDDIRLALFDR